MEWLYAQHLPDFLQRTFNSILTDFLTEPVRLASQADDDDSPRADPSLLSQLSPNRVRAPSVDRLLACLKEILSSDREVTLSKRLMDAVAAIPASAGFKDMPGAVRRSHSVAVEFVNLICAVLGLEGAIRPQVDVLKRVRIFLKEEAEILSFLNLILVSIATNNVESPPFVKSQTLFEGGQIHPPLPLPPPSRWRLRVVRPRGGGRPLPRRHVRPARVGVPHLQQQVLLVYLLSLPPP